MTCGDVIEVLSRMASASVQCVCTSPPYWGLRDYSIEPSIWDAASGCAHVWGDQDGGRFCLNCTAWRGALGLEPTVELFVDHIVQVFREVRRVLHPSGVLWLNMGDCYITKPQNDGSTFDPKYLAGRQRGKGNRANRTDYPEDLGLKHKDLVMMPARVALALQADCWYLRQQIPWLKRSSMPESTTDRPTGAIEYVYLFAKEQDYYYDREAVRVASSGAAHARGEGVNPKAKMAGPNSRINRDRDPAHQTAAKIRAKQNRSFSAAVKDRVATRAWRNSDELFASLGSFSPKFQGMVVDEAGDPLVMVVNPQPFSIEMCAKCEKIYDAAEHRKLAVTFEERRRICGCGSTDWVSHFATFPERLVEPMILAGTSAAGACPHCGAPYERILEKTPVGDWHPNAKRGHDSTQPARTDNMGKHDRGAANGISKRVESKASPEGAQFSTMRMDLSTNASRRAGGEHDNPFQPPVTIGWRPTCEHANNLHLFTDSMEPVPCVVLDPFSGSGRTGLVAARLGLDYRGIDRNPMYVKISQWLAERQR